MSSLPDLIRQSMLRSRSLFRSRPFSMDHRVVGARSDAVLRTAMPAVTRCGRGSRRN